jgi:ribonuclease HIII
MTWQIRETDFEPLRSQLEATGFSFEARPHQVFLARSEGVVVNLYSNGKVVIAGNDHRAIEALEVRLRELGGTEVEKTARVYPPIAVKGTRIGTDEAGKGDYFGPLVVAGVLATEFQITRLSELGVRDSKLLSDSTIQNYAQGITQILERGQYDVITISPARYNSLYENTFHNVNGILGWAHARAIENLLQFREPCEQAIADQFGDKSYIANALMKKGRAINLIQVPKAERDPVVAGASILARAGFITKMREMSESFGLTFPKGASHVEPFAREFGKVNGIGGLRIVAKVHFATTAKLGLHTTGPVISESLTPAAETLSPVHEERDQDNLRLECYVMISAFERELRSYLELRLRQAYDDRWWEEGVPVEVRSKAERRRDAELKQGKNATAVDCLDFDHYQLILTLRENWERIFAADFKSKEQLIARLTLLKANRDPVSHTRPLEQRNKLEVIAAIDYLRRVTNQRRLDEFQAGHGS